MHNRVHNWVAGTMSGAASPSDPVFWLHKAMIDLIYVQWQAAWDSPYAPVSADRPYGNLNDALWGMGGATVAMALDHQSLGYIYDRELQTGWPGVKTK
jgi:tyrosinase